MYDWDSLRFDLEPAIAGAPAARAPAATFPANRPITAPNLPSADETLLFVRDYEAVRGEPFSKRERKTTIIAAIYALAYLARCEHASRPAHRTRDHRKICS